MKYLVEIGCPVNETDAAGGLAINGAIRRADDTEIHVSRFLALGAVLMDSSVQGLEGIKTTEYLWSHNREGIPYIACLDPFSSDSRQRSSYLMSPKLFCRILKTC